MVDLDELICNYKDNRDKMSISVAVVGATGNVGRVLIYYQIENFLFQELQRLASRKSVGTGNKFWRRIIES